ncbi:Eukaryotic translation initiation factor 2-alpha kinase 4, partial [Operophtera brumata]
MFHVLATAMERLAVLIELRAVTVTVNERFDTSEYSKQIHVVSQRPTCAELLASEHVPRPVPEGALSGLLSHALSDRGARGYQRLISACLDQKLTTAEDYTHGATEFAPPLLTPRAKAWDQYPNAVKVMTASGS